MWTSNSKHLWRFIPETSKRITYKPLSPTQYRPQPQNYSTLHPKTPLNPRYISYIYIYYIYYILYIIYIILYYIYYILYILYYIILYILYIFIYCIYIIYIIWNARNNQQQKHTCMVSWRLIFVWLGYLLLSSVDWLFLLLVLTLLDHVGFRWSDMLWQHG